MVLLNKKHYNPDYVGELIDQAAVRYPDRILFEHGNMTLSAKEASEKSTILAKRLAQWKLTDGSIFVIAPNSIYQPLVMYAAAKVGMAYCCMEKTVAVSYWLSMIKDFRVKALVYHPMYLAEVLKLKHTHKSLKLICLDTLSSMDPDFPMPSRATLTSLHDSKLSLAIDSVLCSNSILENVTLPKLLTSNPVLLAFTSGTSNGTIRKAITLTHENIMYITAAPPIYDKHTKNFLHFGLSWMTAARRLFSCVTQGQTLVFADQPNLTPLQNHIAAKTERFNCTGTTMRDIANASPEIIQALKRHCEKIGQELIMKVIHVVCPEINLTQYYGSTETSLKGCMLSPEDHLAVLLNPTEKNTRRIGSVGKPELGIQVKVFDENNNECPVGVKGDLVLRTPSMSPGYYNNPTKTAELFRNGWINMGDVGYIDEDGYVYVEGRKNEYEIFTHSARLLDKRELENAIDRVDGVEQSIVTVASFDDSRKMIVFVAKNPNYEMDKLLLKSRIMEDLKLICSRGNLPHKIYIMNNFPLSIVAEKVLVNVMVQDVEAGKNVEDIIYKKQ
ncbi:hypothetical protein HDV02_003689 [Globomyces sp. JEL0801]|nr:hypothetical protein HDV02_003689 [Globomyces sp. JEL0801]